MFAKVPEASRPRSRRRSRRPLRAPGGDRQGGALPGRRRRLHHRPADQRQRRRPHVRKRVDAEHASPGGGETAGETRDGAVEPPEGRLAPWASQSRSPRPCRAESGLWSHDQPRCRPFEHGTTMSDSSALRTRAKPVLRPPAHRRDAQLTARTFALVLAGGRGTRLKQLRNGGRSRPCRSLETSGSLTFPQQLRQLGHPPCRRAHAIQGAEPDPARRARLGVPRGRSWGVHRRRAGAAAGRRRLVQRNGQRGLPES